MAEERRNALVPRQTGAVEKIGTGASSILSGMVSDALALARSQVQATFQIGGYDFRSPDYRQILLWAEALKIAPTAVVQRLEGASLKIAAGHGEPISFKVENGAILSAVWDLDSLPLASFEWVAGLSIHEFAFKGSPETAMEKLSIRLPHLRRLIVPGIKLKALDLSDAPKLNTLWCHDNQLTRLDLLHAPNLSTLWCHKNQIGKLDLSGVRKLSALFCDANRIAALDVSKVPELRALGCSGNRLTELDLSNVPALASLYCQENKLTKLTLSNLPKLALLWCHKNRLANLDLSNVPKLSELDCTENQLTALDLSNVPELNGPDCRSYHLIGRDNYTSWRRYLKYRAYDSSVKVKGLRTFSKPELLQRISAQKPVLYGIDIDTMADWIIESTPA